VDDKEYWGWVERDTDTELIWGENDTYLWWWRGKSSHYKGWKKRV